MMNKKIVMSVLMIFAGLMPQVAQALDVRDSFGRTELMKYVIAQEVEIASIQAEIQRCFVTCFDTDGHYSNYVYKIYEGQCTPFKKGRSQTRLKRRKSSTSEDFVALAQNEQNLENLIEKTVETIKLMFQPSDQYVIQEINACDSQGNTVFYYTVTPEIRNVLRHQADLEVWSSFKQKFVAAVPYLGAVVVIGMGVAGVSALVYNNENKSAAVNDIIIKNEDNGLNSEEKPNYKGVRDEDYFGRPYKDKGSIDSNSRIAGVHKPRALFGNHTSSTNGFRSPEKIYKSYSQCQQNCK